MFITILCFLTKNLELAENVVLLEVLYKHVDCVDIYDFIHLLTYYQLCINFQKKKNWRWIVFKYCGGFLCVFIKPKIWFIWWRKCLNRWNLFLFSPPFSLRVLCFFSIFNMKTTCYNTNDHYNCNVVDFHWVFNSFLNLVVWFFFIVYYFFEKWLLVTILLYIIYRVFLPWSLSSLKKKIYPMLSMENVVVQETETNLLCCYGCI